MAREMRAAGPAAIVPSKLYVSAQEESREHYAALPVLIREKTRELYRHAMYEAGASGEAPGRCPVCGWEADDAS